MKLAIAPILVCTDTEYKTEIEPIIQFLGEIDLCPRDNENRRTTWNCDVFEDCSCCPFGKANRKVREAGEILQNIKKENS